MPLMLSSRDDGFAASFDAFLAQKRETTVEVGEDRGRGSSPMCAPGATPP